MYYNEFFYSHIRDLVTILSQLNPVEITTPLNEKAAKADFLKQAGSGKIKNPCFEYDEKKLKTIADYADDFGDISRELLMSVRPNSHSNLDRMIVSLLKRSLHEYGTVIKLAECIHGISDRGAKEANLALFGKPSSATIEAAREAAKQPWQEPEQEWNSLGAIDIALEFEEKLKDLGLNDWQVVIDEHCAAIDVRDNSSTIFIPADRKVSYQKLTKLIGHEINCHLRGSANTRALLERLLSADDSPLVPLVPWLAKSTDETIYEGVAKMSDVALEQAYQENRSASRGVPKEEIHNSELPSPWYTLAIEYALSGHSFSKTAEKLLKDMLKTGMPEEKAINKVWVCCRRVFRGARHPEKASCYAFTKDYGYLEGYLILANRRVSADFLAACKNYSTLSLRTLQDFSTVLNSYRPEYSAAL